MVKKLAIKGNFASALSDSEVKSSINQYLLINEGQIEAFSEAAAAEYEVFDLSQKLILPAFVDLHFHWVQQEVCLAPKDKLKTWLDVYTYPCEAKFVSRQWSQEQAQTFIPNMLARGTLAGAVYASTYAHSVDDFIGALPEPLRDNYKVGSVSMVQGMADAMLETVDEAKAKAEALAAKHGKRYVVTPRYLPSSSSELLRESARIAAENDLWIQTHLAETEDAVESNTDLLDEAGLLTAKTILGHGIYLDENALAKIARAGSKIAHCPSSNAPIEELGLGSGLFDYQAADAAGVDWALASDIGAGPYLSMLDVMKSFVEQHQRAARSATATQALYRASLKGAEILGMADRMGSLEAGKEANFVVIDAADIDVSAGIEQALMSLLSKDRAELDQAVEACYYRGERLA